MTDLSELKSNLFPVDSDALKAVEDGTEKPQDIDQALKDAGLPDADVPT